MKYGFTTKYWRPSRSRGLFRTIGAEEGQIGSAKKIMMIAFGMHAICFSSVTNLLYWVNDDLNEKRQFFVKKKVSCHEHKEPVHTCVFVIAKFFEMGYEFLPHPPYSSDLSHSEYFLFLHMAKWLGEMMFSSIDEVPVKRTPILMISINVIWKRSKNLRKLEIS